MRPLDQDTTLDAGIAMHRSSWLSAEIIPGLALDPLKKPPDR
jgi:hypothetical protein